MRLYKSFMIFLGTKVPFNELPDLIEKYLKNLGLKYKNFLYYLSDYDHTDMYKDYLARGLRPEEATAYLTKVKGCRKAQIEHPELGPLRKDKANEKFYLSNLDRPSAEATDIVYPIMNKIYRRYGISDTMLVYHGVNFFHIDSPCEIIHENGELKELIGPRIVLFRDNVLSNENRIELHFDITEDTDDSLLNSYRDAMVGILPARAGGKKEYSYCVLTDEETAYYADLKTKAEPLARRISKKIRKDLKHVLADFAHPTDETPISLAPVLKKAAKEFGYTYIKPYYHFFDIIKETPNSHILHGDLNTGRYGDELGISLSLLGAGFEVPFKYVSFDVSTPEEVSEAVFGYFEAVKKLETAELAELDAMFPKSPEKYIKTFVTSRFLVR